MTVQLSSLRVTADMDASGYIAGMNQKVAADKAGAASSREVGAAVQQTDTKISAAGNALERLQRQTIEGYSASQRFEAGLRTLQRAFDTGNVSTERAQQILVGLHQRYGLIANAEQLAANGQTQLAQAVTVANAALAAQEAQVEQNTNAIKRAGAANDNWRRTNLRFQLFDIGQTIGPLGVTRTLMQQGPQIVQMYAGQGGVRAALSDVGAEARGVMGIFGRLGPIIAGAAVVAGVALLGLQHEIRETSGVAVSYGDVAKGVLQAIGQVIYSELRPAIEAIAPWFSWVWDNVVAGVKWTGNLIINSFRAAYEDVKLVFTQFPNIVAVAIGSAVNLLVSGVENMINYVTGGIDTLIGKVNEWVAKMPDWMKPEGGAALGTIGKVTLGRVDISRAVRELGGAVDRRNERIGDIMDDDPLGDFGDRVRRNAVRNYGDRQKDKKGARSRQTDYDRELESIRDRIEAMKAERDAIGLTEAEAARLTVTRKLEAAAMKDAIGLSPERIAEIQKEADAYARMVEEMERVEKAREAMEFARETVRGFIDDFRSGIEQGKGIWESFANAALNALDRITDKLLDDVLDAIFKVRAAGEDGGGGIFGWLMKGLGWLLGGGGSSVTLPGTAPIPTPRPMSVTGAAMSYAAESSNTVRAGFASNDNRISAASFGSADPLPRRAVNAPMPTYAPAPAANALQQVVLVVRAEEGDLFRPVIRAESQDVAIKVVDENNKTLPGRLAYAQSHPWRK